MYAPLIATILLLFAASVQAQVSLSWDDNYSDEDAFVIERKLNGGSFAFLNNSVLPFYVDKTAVAGTVENTYTYRVAAFNQTAQTAYSNEASKTFLGNTPPPPPPPLPACAVGIEIFIGCYYNNSDFTSLVFTRNDPQIDFNWGDGSPSAGMGADTFSVRWQGDFNVPAGNYEITIIGDDGVRLWIDGTLVIDEWRDQAPTTFKTTRALASGVHSIRLDYYENNGGALVKLSAAVVAAPPPPTPSAPTVTMKRHNRWSCNATVTSLPPDNTGGWTVQFLDNNSTFGSADSSSPYSVTAKVARGNHLFRGVWNKGEGATLISAATSSSCP